MTNAIYIATVEPNCGKSLVSLGLAEMLLRQTPRVGIFRPVIRGSHATPRQKYRSVAHPLRLGSRIIEETYAFFRAEAAALITRGRYDEALDQVIQKYKALESRVRFCPLYWLGFGRRRRALRV